ncbi:MAG: hypothetical protein ACRD3C_06880, partial [Vicinamibacterales bacterium]
DVPEHLAQLDAALRAGIEDDGRCRRFVDVFIRPYGIDIPATPRLVEAIETAATRPAVDGRPSQAGARLLRPLLARYAARAERDAAIRLEAKTAQRKLKSQLAKERKKKQRKAQKRRQAEAGETA